MPPIQRLSTAAPSGSRLNLIEIETRIYPNKIDENLDIRSDKAAASQYRNDIIRKISDFISEEMGIGKTGSAMGMPKDSYGEIKKQFKEVGVSPGALPDAMVDPDEFKAFTGFSLTSTMKTNALGNQLPSGFETKIFGDGQAEEPDITAISRSIGTTEGDAITRAMGGRHGVGPRPQTAGTKMLDDPKEIGLYGPRAVNMLFSDTSFKEIRKQLFLNARVKFTNLLIVDTVDIDKAGKQIFKFITDPLGNIAKDVFTNPARFINYFEVSIKIKKEKRRADKWRISIKPTAKLYADMKKNVQDITDKVRKAHTNTFSQNLLNYLVKNKPKTINDKDINSYFELIIGFAKEFERGGMTPFIVRTEISREMPTPIDATINVLTRSKKATKQQKFISGAQISALVQQRLRKIMPQGPRRGPPLSPTIMTNRTGRFRRSIQVVPRYKENVMRFMYDPIYMSLLNTPYNPDELVSNTIREVVQGLFGRQFAILRAQ